MKLIKIVLKNYIKNLKKIKESNVSLFYIALLLPYLLLIRNIPVILILGLPFHYLIKGKDYTRLYEMIKGIKVIKKDNKSFTIFSNNLTYTEIIKQKEKFEIFFNRNISNIVRQKDFRYYKVFFKNESNFKDKYYFQDYLKKSNLILPLFLGVDENNNILCQDLVELKHLFIGGETGGGKSVLLNCIIQSLMYNTDSVYIFVDLKQGVELSDYIGFKNSIVVSTIEDFETIMSVIKDIMIERLKKIRDTDDCKNIQQYPGKLPYIIVVIDEIAEIKISSTKTGRTQSENDLLTILQQGRAGGVHVISATQRSSCDQLDTSIRAGFNKVISFKVGRIETQKMLRVSNTENLKIGEFKTDIDNEKKIYKGFFIDKNHNKFYSNLKHVIKNGKILFNLLEKKETNYNNILHKLFCKLYKGYDKSYDITPSYNIVPKTPSNQVIDLVREIKKLSHFDENPLGNSENVHGGNYEKFIKFLLENSKDDLSIPPAKILMEKCNLSQRKKTEYLRLAEDDGILEKKSATRWRLRK